MRPGEQNGVGRCGVPRDLFAKRADTGAAAQQRAVDSSTRLGQHLPRHLKVARELRVPGFQLPLQAADCQMGINARDDLCTLERFGDEVHGAELESADLVLGVIQRGQENHRGVARLLVFAKAAARLVPVDAGHHDIEQNQRWLGPVRDLDSVLTAARKEQLITTSCQCVMQEAQVRRVIVHEEDADRLSGRRLFVRGHRIYPMSSSAAAGRHSKVVGLEGS